MYLNNEFCLLFISCIIACASSSSYLKSPDVAIAGLPRSQNKQNNPETSNLWPARQNWPDFTFFPFYPSRKMLQWFQLTSSLFSAFVDFFNPGRQDWVVMICLKVHHGANNESVEVLCRPQTGKKNLSLTTVVLFIYCPLPHKTKLKFSPDFKVFCFRFELKVLNESKYSMPWVRCAF